MAEVFCQGVVSFVFRKEVSSFFYIFTIKFVSTNGKNT